MRRSRPKIRMDIAQLEKQAIAATPGYWATERGWVGSPPQRSDRIWSQYPGPFRMVADGMRPADAEFIAAARPAVVLELIRALREVGMVEPCRHGHVCLVNAGHLLHPLTLDVCELGAEGEGDETRR